jgi:hypothetical protein
MIHFVFLGSCAMMKCNDATSLDVQKHNENGYEQQTHLPSFGNISQWSWELGGGVSLFLLVGMLSPVEDDALCCLLLGPVLA